MIDAQRFDLMEAAASGRFGHHPDPATDFEIEVDEILAQVTDRKLGVSQHPGLEDRIRDAMKFCSVDTGSMRAIQAKAALIYLAREVAQL